MLIRTLIFLSLLSSCLVVKDTNESSVNNKELEVDSHKNEINRVIIEGFDIDTTICKPYLL